VLGELLAVLDASSADGHILLSAAGNTAGSHHGPMTTDPTTSHDDAAFLAILHHVIFEMTPE
jgi:hypothetical protein